MQPEQVSSPADLQRPGVRRDNPHVTPIVLLAGPPSAGKTTAARSLAERLPRSVHVEVDRIREDMVVSGRVLPSPAWGDDLREQLVLARRSATAIAAIYREAGFAVVIDDFLDPNSKLHEYDELRSLTSVWSVVLWPTQDVAHRRNATRFPDGVEDAYSSRAIDHAFTGGAERVAALPGLGWHVIDNTELSVDETVDRLVRLLGY